MRGGYTALFIVLFCSSAFSAVVLTTNVSPPPGQADVPPDAEFEIKQVVFSADEEDEVRKFWADIVGEALPPSPPVAQAPEAPKQPSDWKGVLTIARVISTGVVFGMTVSYLQGGDLGQSIALGLTAGTWSGLMQWKNKPRLNWLAHSSWWKRTPPAEQEKAGLLKRLAKRALQTLTYGGLLSTVFCAVGLNPEIFDDENARKLFKMVAESLYTQTGWEALNQQMRQRAILSNPKREYFYQRLSGLASLTLAAINSSANALNLGDVFARGWDLGTSVSITVGTIGSLAYLRYWAKNRAPSCEAAHGKIVR